MRIVLWFHLLKHLLNAWFSRTELFSGNNSFWMTATFNPCGEARTWRNSVVLPAPRKPVMMDTGTDWGSGGDMERNAEISCGQ